MRALMLLAATCGLLGQATSAGPDMARLASGGADWQFDFEFTAPRRIVVKLPGHERPQVYWYTIYRATNNTGRDRLLFPAFEVLYQTGDSVGRVEADMGTNPAVFAAIKQKHTKAYPFLAEPVLAIGRLLQGSDNARTSVAIWPPIDERADRFSVYVAGLAGRTELVRNPHYDRSQPETTKAALPDGTEVSVTVNPRFFTLRKVLRIDYEFRGDPEARRSQHPVEAGRSWVMR
ncbi:MAG TPA: hypothetical protein VMZ31_02485 [Phycisphaerae bacterium]|nr:hypothetical protein [Phycisphaerae bacterium]